MSLRKYKFEGQDEDLVRPYIVINGEVASIGKLGDVIHMPSISVGDVICPNVSVLMQVFAPDGTFVKDVFTVYHNVRTNKVLVLTFELVFAKRHDGESVACFGAGKFHGQINFIRTEPDEVVTDYRLSRHKTGGRQSVAVCGR